MNPFYYDCKRNRYIRFPLQSSLSSVFLIEVNPLKPYTYVSTKLPYLKPHDLCDGNSNLIGLSCDRKLSCLLCEGCLLPCTPSWNGDIQIHGWLSFKSSLLHDFSLFFVLQLILHASSIILTPRVLPRDQKKQSYLLEKKPKTLQFCREGHFRLYPWLMAASHNGFRTIPRNWTGPHHSRSFELLRLGVWDFCGLIRIRYIAQSNRRDNLILAAASQPAFSFPLCDVMIDGVFLVGFGFPGEFRLHLEQDLIV